MSRLPVFLILVAAFLLRVAGNWSKVFTDQGVRFMANDPWHHARQIQQLVRHFPHRMTFDPYMIHPGGQSTPLAPFTDYLIATTAWLIGLGSPSAHLVDSIAALAPALFGTLVAVFAYELGKVLSGRAAGLVAALIVAVMPGQLFGRTLLGFVDHHALESLLVAATMYFLVRALDAAQPDASVSDVFGDENEEPPRGLAAFRPSLRRSVLAGFVFGLYLLTWSGSALVALVLAAWATVQVNVCHMKGLSAAHVARVGVPFILTAFLVLLPFVGGIRASEFHLIGLGLALAAVILLPIADWRLRAWKAKRLHLPTLTLAGVATGVLALRAFAPGVLEQGIDALSWFSNAQSETQRTVTEAEPLFMPLGVWSYTRAWDHFGISLPLSLGGFAVVGAAVARLARPRDTLLLVWAVLMLLITFGQNRFEYYSIVTTALLVGVFVGPWLARNTTEKSGVLRYALPVVVVAAAVLPNGKRLLALAQFHPGPSEDWVATLHWMRDNTPEPFSGRENFFEARYDFVEEGDAPKADYGVMSWWDQGYWLTQIAQRPPAANPTQSGARRAARFFLEGSEREAAAQMREKGYRYVVMDRKGPVIDWGPQGVAGNITEMRFWAGLTDEDLLAVYHFPRRDGGYEPSTLFHEEYYRSMMVRLYLYDGLSVRGKSAVVEWRDTTLRGGERIKEVTNLRRFEKYEKAVNYLAQTKAPNARIVGENPAQTCVPLPKIRFFRRVYQSPTAVYKIATLDVHEVKVFELLDR